MAPAPPVRVESERYSETSPCRRAWRFQNPCTSPRPAHSDLAPSTQPVRTGRPRKPSAPSRDLAGGPTSPWESAPTGSSAFLQRPRIRVRNSSTIRSCSFGSSLARFSFSLLKNSRFRFAWLSRPRRTSAAIALLTLASIVSAYLPPRWRPWREGRRYSAVQACSGGSFWIYADRLDGPAWACLLPAEAHRIRMPQRASAPQCRGLLIGSAGSGASGTSGLSGVICSFRD